VLERLRQRRITIVLALIVSIVLITLDTRGNPTIDRAREIGTEMFTPVRAIGRTIAGPFQNAWHGAFEYQKLRKENIRLRDDASRGQADAISGIAAQESYDRLRAQLNLPNIGNIQPVRAEVVGGSASNFEQGTLEINKGTSSGIKQGMAVITSAGMIGSVRQVTDTRAKVRLLFDPNLGVSVKIIGQRVPPTTTTTTSATTVAPKATPTTRRAATTTTLEPDPTVTNPDGSPADTTPTETASVTTTTIALKPITIDIGSTEGHGRGQLLEVRLVDEKYDVQVGDDVVTSGESDDRLPSLYPPNLPVGKVVEVSRQPGSTQLLVKVKPLADLESFDFVTVLLYSAGG
jgi:cell shape-determining protein MreC